MHSLPPQPSTTPNSDTSFHQLPPTSYSIIQQSSISCPAPRRYPSPALNLISSNTSYPILIQSCNLIQCLRAGVILENMLVVVWGWSLDRATWARGWSSVLIELALVMVLMGFIEVSGSEYRYFVTQPIYSDSPANYWFRQCIFRHLLGLSWLQNCFADQHILFSFSSASGWNGQPLNLLYWACSSAGMSQMPLQTSKSDSYRVPCMRQSYQIWLIGCEYSNFTCRFQMWNQSLWWMGRPSLGIRSHVPSVVPQSVTKNLSSPLNLSLACLSASPTPSICRVSPCYLALPPPIISPSLWVVMYRNRSLNMPYLHLSTYFTSSGWISVMLNFLCMRSQFYLLMVLTGGAGVGYGGCDCYFFEREMGLELRVRDFFGWDTEVLFILLYNCVIMILNIIRWPFSQEFRSMKSIFPTSQCLCETNTSPTETIQRILASKNHYRVITCFEKMVGLIVWTLIQQQIVCTINPSEFDCQVELFPGCNQVSKKQRIRRTNQTCNQPDEVNKTTLQLRFIFGAQNMPE